MNCWYMSGAGNDFMVVDARGADMDFSEAAKKLCAIRHADGFMAVDVSEKADFRLHFYNSDGSRGEMCGNGSRCVCKFAYDHGIAGEAMTVETDAGIVRGWRLDENTYRVQLNPASVAESDRIPGVSYVELGDPGVPHAVTEIPGLSWENRDDLREKAIALRHHAAFPKGANVNFYTWLGTDHIRILTFERGVEDYTLACGTGSASTAVMLKKQGRMAGNDLTVDNPGGRLLVRLEGEKVFLTGPAELVADYEVF